MQKKKNFENSERNFLSVTHKIFGIALLNRVVNLIYLDMHLQIFENDTNRRVCPLFFVRRHGVEDLTCEPVYISCFDPQCEDKTIKMFGGGNECDTNL